MAGVSGVVSEGGGDAGVSACPASSEVILGLWAPGLAGFRVLWEGCLMAEMKRRQRRSFTPEYRREAARLVIDTGRPIASWAWVSSFWDRWVRAKREREAGESVGPLSVDERAELIALGRKVSRSRRRILSSWEKQQPTFRVEASSVERYELMEAERANL